MMTHKTVYGSIRFLFTQKTLTTNGNNTQNNASKFVNLTEPVRGECPRSGCIESMNGSISRILLLIALACSTLDATNAPTVNKRPQTVTIGGLEAEPGSIAHGIIAAADLVQAAAKRSREERERRIQQLNDQNAVLGQQRDQNRIGASEYDQRLKTNNEAIANLRKEADEDTKAATNLGNNLQTAMLGGWNTWLDEQKEAEHRKTQIAVAAVSEAVKAEEGNRGLMERTRLELNAAMDRLQFMSRPENLKAYAGTAALATTGIIGGYYTLKLTHKYLDNKLNKVPVLVRKTSRTSWYNATIDYMGSFFYTAPTPETLDEVILAPNIEKEIRTIGLTTKTTHDKALPYRHLLLYGPPGTGKTKIAQILATTSGMDYAIMSGADLAQFAEGQDVQALQEIMDWAEQGDKGTILFIDEAESFLRKRGSYHGPNAERWIRLLNAFLSRTGQPSTKFMLVFATNRPEDLDQAALDRTDKQVSIPLPGVNERARILNLYLTKYIANDHRPITINGNVVEAQLHMEPTINAAYVTGIAQRLEGFSGRKIEQLVMELRTLCYLSNDLVLTHEMVDAAVEAMIAQQKALAAQGGQGAVAA
jgi:AAA+ superfamily predicted ATPase